MSNQTHAEHILQGFLPNFQSKLALRQASPNRRFRRVENVGEWLSIDSHAPKDDIMPFVTLSDECDDIRKANPGLKPHLRHQLYKKWHDISPDAFLFLEVRDAEGNWRPAAISIIFPITNDALSQLQKGELKAVELERQHIAERGQAGNLLIDTWVIDKQLSSLAAGFGHALLAKHLSSFEPLVGQQIMIEPDFDVIKELAALAHFNEPENNYYALPITPERVEHDPQLKELLQFVRNSSNIAISGDKAPPSPPPFS